MSSGKLGAHGYRGVLQNPGFHFCKLNQQWLNHSHVVPQQDTLCVSLSPRTAVYAVERRFSLHNVT